MIKFQYYHYKLTILSASCNYKISIIIFKLIEVSVDRRKTHEIWYEMLVENTKVGQWLG